MASKFTKDKVQNSTECDSKADKGRPSRGETTKGKRNNKGRMRNRQGRQQSADQKGKTGANLTSYPHSEMSNDFEWYNKNPSLTLGVAQIPYPNRPGMELRLGSWSFAKDGVTPFMPHHSIPGFMAIRYVPTLGSAHDYQDAVNVAAREIYARVRDAYSGTLAVTAADLMMYVGAIDSIYSEISYLRRIYGILNSYTSENYNFPDGALRAMGFSADQVKHLRTDKMNLYTGINMLISRVRKYKLPSVMDLFKRHWWMAENIFADAPSLRSQMYFFHPDGAWQIGFNAQGTELSYAFRNEADMSLGAAGLLKFATDLIDALDASEDAYTMNGYLQRAFADVPSFTVEDLDINYQVAPQYNPEVLLQIMNCVVPSGSFNAGWKYVQNVDNQLITDTITYVVDENSISKDCNPYFVLRQDVDNPMVGDTVIATRMMAVLNFGQPGSAPKSYHVSMGTEVPKGFRTAQWNSWKQNYEIGDLSTSFVTQSTDLLFARLDEWGKFNHAPMIYLLETSPDGNITALRLFGDYYNPTTVNQVMLDDLHSVCALSELNAFGIYGK